MSFVQSLSRHLWSPSMEVMEVWQPDSDRHRTYRPVVYEVVRRTDDDVPVEVTILLIPDDSHLNASPRSSVGRLAVAENGRP